jgi:hypothetical protein
VVVAPAGTRARAAGDRGRGQRRPIGRVGLADGRRVSCPVGVLVDDFGARRSPTRWPGCCRT